MKGLCIVTNGFEEVEFLATIGILRRGNVDIDIYSFHNDEAMGRYGINVNKLNDISKLDYKNYDFLFFPGGPEYIEMERTPWFLNIVKYFMDHNKLVATICAGPTIIGHLGYLKGRNYTCFTSMNEDFGGTYIDKYCVQDGNLITGRSAAASIDFAFMILEAVKGKDEADKVKISIYY